MDRVTIDIAALRKLAERLGAAHSLGYEITHPNDRIEAATAILALLTSLEAAQKTVAEWHDEVARFNLGWERRSEPYSALEDEFEQMGHAWANYDKVRSDLEAARKAFEPVLHWYDGGGEVDVPPLSEMLEGAVADLQADRTELLETHRKLVETRQQLEAARRERDAWERIPDVVELKQLRTDLAAARAEVEALRADKERMDYLDQERYREECWRDAGMPSAAPFSLFRQNLPITRETLDAARARWEKK